MYSALPNGILSLPIDKAFDDFLLPFDELNETESSVIVIFLLMELSSFSCESSSIIFSSPKKVCFLNGMLGLITFRPLVFVRTRFNVVCF